MEPEEVLQINQYLQKIHGSNLPSELYVDNLHCPYLEFSKEYLLPSVSTTKGVDYPSAILYLEQVAPFIPEWISEAQVLPQPKPKKEIHKLFLVKKVSMEEGSNSSTQGNDWFHTQFVWVLSLSVGYLGGSPSEKILKPKVGESSPSVFTNRIYFHSALVPVATIYEASYGIQDFQTLSLSAFFSSMDSITTPEIQTNSKDSEPGRILPYSELFDEPDQQMEEERIRQMFSLDSHLWKPGSVFYPIGLDLGTFSFRFLETQFSKIERIWKKIGSRFFGKTEFQIQNGKKVLEDYLTSFQIENSLSPSGNLRWKILRNSGNLLNLDG